MNSLKHYSSTIANHSDIKYLTPFLYAPHTVINIPLFSLVLSGFSVNFNLFQIRFSNTSSIVLSYTFLVFYYRNTVSREIELSHLIIS